MLTISSRAWQPVYPLLWVGGVWFYTSFIIVSISQLLNSQPLFISIDLKIRAQKNQIFYCWNVESVAFVFHFI